MNIKEFFKRDNLDEMQKQTLLKIESCGFWALWVLLLAALIIESLLGFAPREMAAEWFIFMLGITMVAAPGVPGGAIMAALGILQSMLSFDESAQALMIALYIAMDSFGTACNVTGDGAIALIIDKIMGKNRAERLC